MRLSPLSLSALVVGLSAAACSDPAGPADPIKQLPRSLTLVEQELIERSNGFGLELFRRIVAGDERPIVVLSPLCASMGRGMTLNGARAATFDAMRSTLGFGRLSQVEINEAYRNLIDMLTDLDPAVRFDIANAVWAN